MATVNTCRLHVRKATAASNFHGRVSSLVSYSCVVQYSLATRSKSTMAHTYTFCRGLSQRCSCRLDKTAECGHCENHTSRDIPKCVCLKIAEFLARPDVPHTTYYASLIKGHDSLQVRLAPSRTLVPPRTPNGFFASTCPHFHEMSVYLENVVFTDSSTCIHYR